MYVKKSEKLPVETVKVLPILEQRLQSLKTKIPFPGTFRLKTKSQKVKFF